MLIITRLWYNNSMRIRSYRDGFTLIEISLSLVFVTILALAITLIISNTIGAYQRGLILNQVNTLGMSLVDDFRLALQNSSGKTLTSTCAIVYKNPVERANCEADEAFNFVSVTKNERVRIILIRIFQFMARFVRAHILIFGIVVILIRRMQSSAGRATLGQD